MQDSDISVVRGVNIAAAVLSALSALVAAALLALAIAAAVWGGNPGVWDGYVDLRDAGIGFSNGYDAQHSLDSQATGAIVGGTFAIMAVFVGIGLAMCLASLIAGVKGARNCRKPEKLGGTFVWQIVGAVCAILTGRVITCVLLVIGAVYVNRLRNPQRFAAAPAGYPYGGQPQQQVPYQSQQQAYQQPYQQAPQQQDPYRQQPPYPPQQ